MNLATVGTSWITEKFIDAAVNSGRYSLHTVYSRREERAEDFKQKNGSKHAANDINKLLDKEIDIVYIASPNSLHYEQAKFFIENGKHVISEKPMVTKEGQLDELYRLADNKGVFLFEALRHINTPNFKVIKENIERITPIRCAVFTYNQFSSRYAALIKGELSNVFDPDFSGGTKFDLGIYPVSFAAALFGKPKSIQYSQVEGPKGIDIVCGYILNYGDFLCSIMCSKACDDIIYNEILGERGGLKFEKSTDLGLVKLALKGEPQMDISVDQYDNDMQHEAENFARIIAKDDRKAYERLREISRLTAEILTVQ